MDRYQKTVSFDDETYLITMFTPTTAIKLGTRLFRVIGEPLSLMAGAIEKDVTVVIPQAVHALMAKADETEVLSIISELMKSATYRGQAINFELHFQGRLKHLGKLLMEIVKFQYEDFLGGVVAAKGKATATAHVVPKT